MSPFSECNMFEHGAMKLGIRVWNAFYFFLEPMRAIIFLCIRLGVAERISTDVICRPKALLRVQHVESWAMGTMKQLFTISWESRHWSTTLQLTSIFPFTRSHLFWHACQKSESMNCQLSFHFVWLVFPRAPSDQLRLKWMQLWRDFITCKYHVFLF